MAAEFLESDVDGLFRLAVLVDQYWKEPDVKLAAEIRMQEARFGLSPIDRRRLQWEVQRVEAGESKRKPAAMPVPSGDDPRRVLQVVQ